MQKLDDMELVRQFAVHHSEAAFETLVARHINLVYSAAMRQVGDPHLAQEITQAVFVILARKAASLPDAIFLIGWLFKTTRYAASAELRAAHRRRRREEEAHMQSLISETPEAAWQHIAPLLDEALANLNETDRRAVLLRFFEGQTLGEVGAALSLNEEAARKRVNRGVEKLRKYFLKRGVTQTAAAIAVALTANSVQAAPVSLTVTITATAAKGAAVSSSTLTIIKGALKIMAWTKAKVAVVASTAIILTAITTVTLTNYVRNAPPAQTGRLKLPTGDVTPMIGYGASRDVIILASNGSLWSWGEERLGWPVLGLANTNIQNTVSLRRIGNETDWVSLAVGGSQNLAIKSDGTLWGWGENLYYQLGDGTKITRSTPVPSIPGNDWKQAATGTSSFALKSNGTLWAWGNNWAGQLGIGTTKATTNAVQVGTSTNWVKVFGGGIQTVGLQSDGSLWFWGSFTGDSEDKNQLLVPTRISPDTNWVDACFGYFTMFALKSDGTLWSWGNKAHFYTGVSASMNSTPMQVGTENEWQSISSSSGGFYHLLRKKDGSFWALDASEHRMVKLASKYKPVSLRKIDLQKEVVSFVAGGDDIGVVLTRDGEVWTWGKVIGEHSQKDHWGPKGELLSPRYKIIHKPWQVSNID